VIADISLGDIIWALIVFFFMVVYLIMLFSVVVDLYRDDDTSGWGKAAWVVFLLVVPVISVIVYLGVRGHGMGRRAMRAADEENASLDRETLAAWPSPVDQIARAKELLDAGAIDQTEYDELKATAMRHSRTIAGDGT
jgi:hypothetical protein